MTNLAIVMLAAVLFSGKPLSAEDGPVDIVSMDSEVARCVHIAVGEFLKTGMKLDPYGVRVFKDRGLYGVLFFEPGRSIDSFGSRKDFPQYVVEISPKDFRVVHTYYAR